MTAIRGMAILGTGAVLPRSKVTAGDVDARVGKWAGWTRQRIGVIDRYFCADESQIDLAVAAANQALAAAGCLAEEIDVVVAAAAVPYQPIPATAPLIQRRLGIPEGRCAAFDVNSTCLSFVTALDMLASHIALGRYRRGLIVSAEVASRGLPWDERPEVAALFGDGAAAAVVGTGAGNQGIVAARLETYPSGYEDCELAAGGTRFDFNRQRAEFTSHSLFRMDGKALFRRTLEQFDGFLDRLLGECGWTREDVDVVVPHQASPGALHHLIRRCGFRRERIIDIIARQGNQIAASLPSALHEARVAGHLRSGAKALLLGTSAGISLGGLALIA